MEFKNCKKCRAIFTGGGDLCLKCKEEENNTFMKVRDYVLSNPQSDLQTVARETNISEKVISALLRDRKIRVTDGLAGSLKCERCHKPINFGRFCEECQKKILSIIKKPSAKSEHNYD